jgi:glycosyltransferase involved in cell wall biosynthesis
MDLGADARVIRVIGNTVDDVRFSPGPALPSLREKYGLADDTRVILTVARLSAAEGYKGYDTIIRVLPQVKQVIPRLRYLLVGQGDDLPRLEHLAHEIGVAADVSFCGFVADSDLADHYRLADIFAMPSRGEGFGIVFLEALACGTLVIGGSIDGARDALDDGHLGELVDPACDNAISSALISALETASMRNFADRASLRARMLARHGRAAFREKVFGALAALG